MKRLSAVLVALIATASPAIADDDLLMIEPASSDLVASAPPGTQVEVKPGDIVYWEDERKVPLAIVGGQLDQGSGFFGSKRALAEGARLRKASLRGRTIYCAIDRYAQEENKGVLCMADDGAHGAFDRSLKLSLSRKTKPGNVIVSGVDETPVEPALPYRAENAYASVAGLRAVVRYRGVKDGSGVLACALEAKGELPPGLKRLLFHDKDAREESETPFAVPAASPARVAVPICFVEQSFRKLMGMVEGTIASERDERPAVIEVARADDKAIAVRLVRPFAAWFVSYDKGPNDTGSMSFQQQDK
jgi:hypothetical protein